MEYQRNHQHYEIVTNFDTNNSLQWFFRLINRSRLRWFQRTRRLYRFFHHFIHISFLNNKLMSLHLPQSEGVIMATTRVRCSNLRWIRVIGIMSCIICTAGFWAYKTASFSIPDQSYVWKSQGSSIKTDVAWLGGMTSTNTTLVSMYPICNN